MMIQIPASPGEVLDKLTILDIKLERIAEPAKRANVAREHAALTEAWDAALIGQGPHAAALGRHRAALREVNERLWDVEDALRGHERRGGFGPDFVELARAVYRTNDRRAALKAEVNTLLGSPLREEKSYAAYDAAAPASVGVFSHEEIFGDGLCKVVFLRGLRAAFPAARLIWLTTRGTVFAGPLRAVAGPPLLDEVVERCGIGATPAELLRRPPAGLGPFDLLLDTQRVLWRTLSLRRVPHRRFLSAALPRRGPVGPHVLDGLFALLERAVGRPVPRDTSPLPLPAPLVEAARAALPEGARPPVALAPGAGGANKIWPLDRFIALAQLQTERGRQPVFLLGPQEAAWRARIAAEVPGAAFPEDHPAFASLGGGPQPLRAAAVAARCAAGVANDAGAGHMIAAAGTPLLSLYGPTRPEKFRPACRRWACLRAAGFGGREMDRIPLPAVAEALERLLAGTARQASGP